MAVFGEGGCPTGHARCIRKHAIFCVLNPPPEKKTPGLIFGSLGGTSEGGSYFWGGGLIFEFQMTFDGFPLFPCASLLAGGQDGCHVSLAPVCLACMPGAHLWHTQMMIFVMI